MSCSVRKIVWNDWPALAAALAVPIVWAVRAGFPYLHRGAAPLPWWLPAGTSVLMLGVVLWRIGRVRRLFAAGSPVAGMVTGVFIAKDRGRLEFVFEHEGRRVHAWMPIHKTKAVLSLSPGDGVDVLFDPAQPRRAIVRRLYAR